MRCAGEGTERKGEDAEGVRAERGVALEAEVGLGGG